MIVDALERLVGWCAVACLIVAAALYVIGSVIR